jgi:VWFA-related protein
MKRAVFITLLLLTFASAADKKGKPKEDDTPKFVSRTSLILIPTVVTDKVGQNVRGLTKEDFGVLEDGEGRNISVFQEITTSTPRIRQQDEANGVYSNEITEDAAQQRFTVMIFDLLNTKFEDQFRGRRELLRFLQETLRPDEPLALMTLGPHGLTMINDFSTDPKTLAAAVQKVRAQRAPQEVTLNSDTARESIQQSVELQNRFTGADRAEFFNTSALDSRLSSFILSNIDAAEARDVRASMGVTLLAMKQVGEFFAGVPGRKTVIWVTGGMPSMHLTLSDLSYAPEIQQQFSAAWEALSRSQVVVYPMDMGGLFNPGFISPRFSGTYFRRFAMDDSVSNLERFAKLTGGKLCIHKMDISSCYQDAQADASHYYLLGYYADVSKLKPGWRKLSVKVLRDNLKVRARDGFFVDLTDRKRSVEEEIMTAIISPIDFTAIPMAVHVDPKGIQRKSQERLSPNASGKVDIKQDLNFVPFQFYVPGNAIVLDKSNNNHLDVSFAAFAKDQKGVIKGEFSKKMEADLTAENVQELLKKGVLFSGDMTLPPGRYNIRFVVRDNTTSQMGSLNVPLTLQTVETAAAK